jgi:2-oxoglutarate dehydrogenase E2 component (dihydrolipoamide succinyltransferase)
VSAQIVVPQLGESVVEARIARWLKKPGDAVSAGEPVVELETEKIDVEVGAEQGGVLVRIAHEEGADVKVGDVLAIVEPSSRQPAGSGAPASGRTPAAQPASAPAEPVAVPPGPAQPREPAAAAADAQGDRATPTARKVAAQHAVDLASVTGSGEGGRVIRKDVEAFVVARAGTTAADRAAPAVPPARDREAMLTTFNEVDMSAVMALRERRKEAFRKRHEASLGIASFFVKACIAALRAFPRLNAEIQGDEMVLKRYYDIGIAVGAPQGLVVPVLRSAERMSFAEIEIAIRAFAAKAADQSLTLDDLRGGTFTITNGGVFGSLLSTPILNPPQVGILGLHKIEERPVAIDGQVVVRPMMYTALTYDHRIVDGLEAVQFLVRVKEYIEDPGHLLIES